MELPVGAYYQSPSRPQFWNRVKEYPRQSSRLSLRLLARSGHPIPAAVLERDVTQAWTFRPELVPVFADIYANPEEHWAAYETCEELVDLEDNFQLWRFRHLKTVERIIGSKPGTGGSSGAPFLKRALELTFFPELFAVRTEIPELPG